MSSLRAPPLAGGVRLAANGAGWPRVDLDELGKIADALGVDAALLIQHD